MKAADHFSPADLGRLANELNRDGICVLRGLFDRKRIADWARAFDALVAERQQRPGGLAPRDQGRFYVTLPWTAPFADPEVFAHPAIRGVLDRVLAQEYHLVQLAADTPVEGSTYQETHRDYRPLFSDDLVTPLYALAVNFPLCDVTEENGPLEMARGTHRIPRDVGLAKLRSGELKLESFPMRMGDVAIRTPLALHRGTPNRTPQPRPMVVMGYVMHWLRTTKVDLKLPRSTYQSYPEELQKLLRCELVDKLDRDAGETYVDFKY
jgi:ectoine hydroxylase-related dioxygenase (phytanoyl-CoA dioxygenase family)